MSEKITCVNHANTPSKGSKCEMDRFIPNRSAVDVDLAHFNLIKENDLNKANLQQETELMSPSKEEYKRRLAEGLLEKGGKNSRILAFKTKAPAPAEGYDNMMRSLYTANAGPRIPRKHHRAIPQAPERILDAPELLDDYYLNLIDWSSTNVVSSSVHSLTSEDPRLTFTSSKSSRWPCPILYICGTLPLETFSS